MTIGSSVYIGTDGTGPGKLKLICIKYIKFIQNIQFTETKLNNILHLGGQWVRTRSGWRLSESEDSEEPSRQEVQDVLGAHIKRESNKYLMERALGINGAPRKSS